MSLQPKKWKYGDVRPSVQIQWLRVQEIIYIRTSNIAILKLCYKRIEWLCRYRPQCGKTRNLLSLEKKNAWKFETTVLILHTVFGQFVKSWNQNWKKWQHYDIEQFRLNMNHFDGKLESFLMQFWFWQEPKIFFFFTFFVNHVSKMQLSSNSRVSTVSTSGFASRMIHMSRTLTWVYSFGFVTISVLRSLLSYLFGPSLKWQMNRIQK